MCDLWPRLNCTNFSGAGRSATPRIYLRSNEKQYKKFQKGDTTMSDEFRPTMFSPAWYAEQEKEEIAEKQRLAEEQANAIRNQPAPVPQSAKERAEQEAIKLYSSIMDEEEKKTQAQRDFATIDARLNEINAQYLEATRHATQNAPLLEKLEKEMRELSPQHEQLQKELNPPAPSLWHGDRYIGGTGNHD